MAVLIVHPEWGIYLGSCMGLGFWSCLDPADQPAAVTFGSREEAEIFIRTWEEHGDPGLYRFPEVVPDPDDIPYASEESLRAQGFQGWSVPEDVRAGHSRSRKAVQ